MAQPAPDYEVGQNVSWWLLEAATLKRCCERLRAQPPSMAAVRKVISSLGGLLRPLRLPRAGDFGSQKAVPNLLSCG